MAWLAALRVEWLLGVAFCLALARWGLWLLRPRLGDQREAAAGDLIEAALCAWVAVFLVIRPFLFAPYSIPSASMRDSLREGDCLLANEWIYRLRAPQRGDIIVFRSPPAAGQGERDFVERLIGLPGDRIDVQDGRILLNGRPLDEPYAPEPVDDPPYSAARSVPQPPYHVPPGRYFVLGDNRNDSLDSRFWGYLDASRIRGKAFLVFWPPRRFRWIADPRPAGSSR